MSKGFVDFMVGAIGLTIIGAVYALIIGTVLLLVLAAFKVSWRVVFG